MTVTQLSKDKDYIELIDTLEDTSSTSFLTSNKGKRLSSWDVEGNNKNIEVPVPKELQSLSLIAVNNLSIDSDHTLLEAELELLETDHEESRSEKKGNLGYSRGISDDAVS